MASRLASVANFIRGRGGAIGLDLLVNAVAPFVIYDLTDKQLGDVGALIASSGPPIVWSLFQFIRNRTVDALSILVLAGIGMSLVALAGGGGARFLQLRENLVTGVIGLIFLGSVLIGRPIIYYLARANLQRSASTDLEFFDGMRENVYFKRTMRVMTLVWGVGLMGRTIAACVLVFAVPIPTYLMISPVIGYATMGALGGWSVLYGRRQRRLGEARRAAEAATAQAASPELAAEAAAAQA